MSRFTPFKEFSLYLLEQTEGGIFSRRLGSCFANSVDEATEIAWRRSARMSDLFGVDPLDVIVWREPKREGE